MKITAFLCVVAVPGLACGCGSEDSKGPPIPAPEPVCDPIPAVDTSSPDHVVTSETELRTALEAGGVIVYDTGGAPETVTVPSELAVTRNTVVDGQGLLTIDGGGASRIFNKAQDVELTVQNMTLTGGLAPEPETRPSIDPEGPFTPAGEGR